MASETAYPEIAASDHKAYMEYGLSLALQSPPKPTNFRVGAVLLDAGQNAILATGYSLELEGNTHAEQCCLMKLAARHGVSEERLGPVLPANTVLYTTMEPWNKRLSGNVTCVDRILGLHGGIKVVYMGIQEPEKFVGENVGRKRLTEAGVEVIHVEGLETRISEAATAGHRD